MVRRAHHVNGVTKRISVSYASFGVVLLSAKTIDANVYADADQPAKMLSHCRK